MTGKHIYIVGSGKPGTAIRRPVSAQEPKHQVEAATELRIDLGDDLVESIVIRLANDPMSVIVTAQSGEARVNVRIANVVNGDWICSHLSTSKNIIRGLTAAHWARLHAHAYHFASMFQTDPATDNGALTYGLANKVLLDLARKVSHG